MKQSMPLFLHNLENVFMTNIHNCGRGLKPKAAPWNWKHLSPTLRTPYSFNVSDNPR